MKNIKTQLNTYPDGTQTIYMTSNSGEYEGEIKGNKVTFELVRDEFFDEDSWVNVLGNEHTFVQLFNNLNCEVEFDKDGGMGVVTLIINKNDLIS